MTKKSLEKEIKLVWMWALILSVVYFTIGAYLKSDGPKFDPSKTYELLKDTLTLTAAFLAPVAAFVLFTDWRREHGDKRNEELVFSTLQRIDTKSNEVRSVIDMVNQEFQENGPEMIDLFSSNIINFKQELVIELGILEKSRDFFDDEAFLNAATAFCQNQIEMLDSLGRLFNSSENLDNCRTSPTSQEDIDWALRFYERSEGEFLPKAEEYLNGFDEHLIRLKDLAKPYKI